MPLKEPTQSKDKTSAKQTPRKPATQGSAIVQPQTNVSSIIQQFRENPGALASQDMFQLQRTLGNRAVVQLLARAARPTTRHKAEANRASQMGLAGVGSLAGQAVVQRKINVNDANGVLVKEIKDPTDAKDYLESKGIHFYYQYMQAAKIVEEIDHPKKVFTYQEPGAAGELVKLLQSYQPDGGDINTPNEGSQDYIQKKLIEIYELMHKQSADSLNLSKDNNKDYVNEKTLEWYKMIGINGLCGGWVEIHKRKPEWIEDLWVAVKSWQPSHGESSAQTLQSLEDHLKGRLKWYESGQGAKEVETLLRNAVAFMAQLEPDEDYQLAPTQTSVTDLRGVPLPKVLSVKKEIKVSNGLAGTAVVDYIQKEIANLAEAHCIAHIETDFHHMSVRVKRTPTSLLLKVVETENVGIETCQSWNEAAKILEEGIYLGSDTNDQDVSITVYQI